ncbi:ribosome maturation factor RimP, partial [Desulfovibrio sp. 1188_IL3213]
MTDNALRETIIRLAQPVVHALGLVIWGVETARAGRTIVRLFVDAPLLPQQPGTPQEAEESPSSVTAPVTAHAPQESPDAEATAAPASATIEQCEEISRHLALALEVEDSIADAYVLEVSTPGLSRLFFSLEQMVPYVGDVVEARLHTPVASTDPS